MNEPLSCIENIYFKNDGEMRITYENLGQRIKLEGCFRQPNFFDRLFNKPLYVHIVETIRKDMNEEVRRYYIPMSFIDKKKTEFEKSGDKKSDSFVLGAILSGNIDKYKVC